MKKTFCIAVAALMFGGLALSSCKKYEDGPALSIHTKKGRVAGDWEVEQYLQDGVDKTSDYRSIIASETFTYDKDGSYTSSATATTAFGGQTSTDNGTWAFIDNKEQITSTSSAANSTADTMQILRLTNKEMWVKTVSGSPVEEVHYKAK